MRRARLNSGLAAYIAGPRNRSSPMLAIGVIFGFIAVLAIINVVEFGRVD
ncbi:MAG TPA: hypothetical protein VGE54_03775 [Brevundimonas sp.]